MGYCRIASLGFEEDRLSIALIALSLLVSLLINSRIKINRNKPSLLLLRVWLINLSLVLVFTAPGPLQFYFIFELSLLPITIIVLSWGYQPERLPAAYALILYTITASFPLLVIVLQLTDLSLIAIFIWPLLAPRGAKPGLWVTLFLLISFLVKFPIFTLHLWLPKAHVEAPVVGSIILAALLLKLGGYGVWRVLSLVEPSLTTLAFQRLALIGGGVVAVLCTQQLDIKILIAYSSVAHISLVISALLSSTPLGALAALSVIIAHGVSSSAMFAGANFIYETSHSRRLTLSRGLLNILPLLRILWFLVCLGNMGAPPTINLVREIWALNTLVSLCWATIVPIAILSFFAAAYTLILYASSQQGQPTFYIMRAYNTSPGALLILFIHRVWLIEGFILFIYSNFCFLNKRSFKLSCYFAKVGGSFSLLPLSRQWESLPIWVRVYPSGSSPFSFFLTFLFNHYPVFSFWCGASSSFPLPPLALKKFNSKTSFFNYLNTPHARSYYWVVSKNIRVG